MEKFERGSIWRRWDLHIHTPETQKNDQFEGKTIEEKWNLFYESIENYIGDGTNPLKAIAVVGITDYLSIDNYLKVIQDKRMPDTVKLIVPNVELRITPLAKNSPINIHCLFDPVLARDLETRFFGKLQFRYVDRNFGASHMELCQLGRIYAGDDSLVDEVAYKRGLEQYVITPEVIWEVFEKDPELREHTIIAVSNSSRDGVSGVVSHSEYFVGKNSQLDATRRSIYQMADVIFSSKESDIKYFLGQGADDIETVKKKCRSLKGCIHGSDAHMNLKLFEPSEKKYCWIKADPTFNGLRQVLYEPEARVRISSVMPETKPDYQVIERVEIENLDFPKKPILFNDKLTCIIGGKSTGKSLLLHNIAMAIDPVQVREKVEVTKGSNKDITGVKVYWADGAVSMATVTDREHKIVYIPQTYLNRLSDEHEELTEIDHIVHDIVQINSTAKNAFENMEQELSAHKLVIDKLIYDLVQQHETLKLKKEKLSGIGTYTGIEKELEKLRKQKEQLSKELNLSEDDIKRYDNAIREVSKIELQIRKISEDREKLEKIESVVTNRPMEYIFSENIKDIVEKAISSSIELADQSWLKNRSRIIDELQIDQQQLLLGRKEYQAVIELLAPKISESEAINKLSESIRMEEEKKILFEEIEKQVNEYEKQVDESLNSLVQAFGTFYSIHNKYADAINSRPELASDDLEFSVETPFRTESFLYFLETTFDRRTLKAHKDIVDIENFSEKWVKENNIKQLIKICLEGTLRLLKGKTKETALREILSDWNNTAYRVKMDGDLIDEMSPGKKALVLLKMLINLADSRCPILIDQPEDDLDNRSIFSELIPFVKRKKIDRQIIVVTHNANVVLGGDAEEIIVANQKGKNSPNKEFRFEYRTGSIEDDLPLDRNRHDVLGKQGIQQHICDILEGGEMAFDLRKHKYHI